MAASVTGEERVRSDLRGMATAALNLHAPLEREARRAAESVTGVADRTGKLAAEIKHPRNRELRDDGFDIGVGTFYGHMVFKGTSHSPAEPPTVPAQAIARDTARAIADYIVRHRHGLA